MTPSLGVREHGRKHRGSHAQRSWRTHRSLFPSPTASTVDSTGTRTPRAFIVPAARLAQALVRRAVACTPPPMRPCARRVRASRLGCAASTPPPRSFFGPAVLPQHWPPLEQRLRPKSPPRAGFHSPVRSTSPRGNRSCLLRGSPCRTRPSRGSGTARAGVTRSIHSECAASSTPWAGLRSSENPKGPSVGYGPRASRFYAQRVTGTGSARVALLLAGAIEAIGSGKNVGRQ